MMKIKNLLNFLIVIKNSIRRFLYGKKIIAEFNIIQSRIDICRKCKYKSGDYLKDMKCQICECLIRYKVRFNSSSCPDGRWVSVDM